MASAAITATMQSQAQQEDAWTGSGMLSSTGSIAHKRQQTSHIAKTYRQAANLYLTRRLPEALSTIEPLIQPPPSPENELAPIATASKGTRIKVWSFYLAFLNSVVELGPEEGKHAFGSVRWKSLLSKARDGTVWEEIVRDGYGGEDGRVDAEVVINLSTLLLTHSPSQSLNQQRLETYFSATAQPSFDISAHLSSSQPRLDRRSSAASGTNTPRDLHSNVKLLELYTLHVLPRNGEWEYAREFIIMSELLDDERKEAFLHALQGVREEQDVAAQKEKELQRRQKDELDEQRRLQEQERLAEQRRIREEEARRREESRKRPPDVSTGAHEERSRASALGSPTDHKDSSRPSRAIPKKHSQINRAPHGKPQPVTLYKRAAALLGGMQTLLLNMGQSMTNSPTALLRMLLFLLMFALAFGRRDIRERVRRLAERAWNSARATLTMGFKVSYI